MKEAYRLALLGGLLLALTACAHDDAPEDEPKPKLICPQVAIIHELESFQSYTGDVRDSAHLVAQSKMHKVTGDCSYVEGDKNKPNDPKRGIDVTFAVSMKSVAGAAYTKTNYEFPYFIAVLSPDDTVLNKNLMKKNVALAKAGDVNDSEENLHIFLPGVDIREAKDYRVLMGFQLSREQVKAIRDKK